MAAKKKTPKKSGQTKKSTTPVDAGTMTLPLSEVHTLKLLLCNKEIEEVRRVVLTPLQAEAERAFQEASQEALKQNESFQEVFASRTKMINEVLETLQDSLLPGYAIVKISPESSEVTAEFRPDAAGKRLD